MMVLGSRHYIFRCPTVLSEVSFCLRPHHGGSLWAAGGPLCRGKPEAGRHGERERERERARQRGVSESPVTALFGTPNTSEGPIG